MKNKSGRSKKPKFDNARGCEVHISLIGVRGNCSKCVEKVGSSDASSNALQDQGARKHVALLMLAKTKYACIVEADESTRKRLEGNLHKDHEDHIAGKGVNSFIEPLQSRAQIYSYV